MKATISRRFARIIFTASLLVSITSPPLVAQNPVATDAKFEIPASDESLPGAGPIRRYDWFRNLWRAKRSGWAHQLEKY